MVSDETPPNLHADETIIQDLTRELQEKIEEIRKMNVQGIRADKLAEY